MTILAAGMIAIVQQTLVDEQPAALPNMVVDCAVFAAAAGPAPDLAAQVLLDVQPVALPASDFMVFL